MDKFAKGELIFVCKQCTRIVEDQVCASCEKPKSSGFFKRKDVSG